MSFTLALATLNGWTPDEAQAAYMRALAELVEFSVRLMPFDPTPDWERYQWQSGAARPDVFRAVAANQARTYAAVNPPVMRTIELVSG